MLNLCIVNGVGSNWFKETFSNVKSKFKEAHDSSKNHLSRAWDQTKHQSKIMGKEISKAGEKAANDAYLKLQEWTEFIKRIIIREVEERLHVKFGDVPEEKELRNIYIQVHMNDEGQNVNLKKIIISHHNGTEMEM